MNRGLFIAASGMLAEQVRQDQLANDLANATTPGYKSDRAAQGSFGELLLADRRTGRAIGSLGMGVRIVGQTTDLRPADMRDTGEPLDLAIQGEGFFAVRTPEGERYTRNGRFLQLPDGTLGQRFQELDGRLNGLFQERVIHPVESGGKPTTRRPQGPPFRRGERCRFGSTTWS